MITDFPSTTLDNTSGKNLVYVCVGEDPVPGSASGMAIGSTILMEEDSFSAKTLLHELRHVDQWNLGPLSPALYGMSASASQLTTGTQCLNIFEYWAGFEEGGYREC